MSDVSQVDEPTQRRIRRLSHKAREGELDQQGRRHRRLLPSPPVYTPIIHPRATQDSIERQHSPPPLLSIPSAQELVDSVDHLELNAARDQAQASWTSLAREVRDTRVVTYRMQVVCTVA